MPHFYLLSTKLKTEGKMHFYPLAQPLLPLRSLPFGPLMRDLQCPNGRRLATNICRAIPPFHPTSPSHTQADTKNMSISVFPCWLQHTYISYINNIYRIYIVYSRYYARRRSLCAALGLIFSVNSELNANLFAQSCFHMFSVYKQGGCI